MLCTMGVRAMYNRCPPAVQKRCDAVHRHSLFVAHLATGLNRVACLGFGGVEFTAGLLHDIGRVIIGVKSPPDAAPPPAGADADCLNAEREQYGIDHCAVGYQFATRNNLPEPLVRAILNHHRPDDEQLQRKLVSLLAVANRVAHHVQREHNIAGYDLDKCPFLPVLAYDWSGEKEDAFRRAVPATVVRALKDTRHMLKAFG
jgi:putative nucleotidyltransferase with HDIG domain